MNEAGSIWQGGGQEGRSAQLGGVGRGVQALKPLRSWQRQPIFEDQENTVREGNRVLDLD
jgi:hypothetical protein